MRIHTWLAVLVLAASVAVVTAGPEPASASNHNVGVVGCSNTLNAINGYHTVTSEGTMWPAEAISSYGGNAVTEWSNPSFQDWAVFDSALSAHPNTTAIWWQLCVRDNSPDTEASVDSIIASIRARVGDMPVYASALDDTPSCTRGDPDKAQQFVDYLLANGDVLAGPVMTPLASNETADGCHANDIGEPIWGTDLAVFFDGAEPPPPPDGGFVDVPTSHTFYSEITAIADAAITVGCNPPLNNQYCPDDLVTRGQMAAFISRAMGLPDATVDYFDDDAGSTHEADINKIATAGVTLGCDTADPSLFCPNDVVSRAQMASFIARALGLTAGAGSDAFIDDDGSTHEANIERLHAAAITLGCNPPDNDRYCPDEAVNRGQMAAFIARGFDL